MDSSPQLPSCSITTFRELQCYTTAQNEAITALVNETDGPPCFTEGVYAARAWTEIWKATWNRGEASFQTIADVRRDNQPNRIDDSFLSEEVPNRCNAVIKPASLDRVWFFACAYFFIRPEYEEAQQAALALCAFMERGAVPNDTLLYSGSPGIGKSVLLLILLLRRLAAGLPTGLQITAEYAILFWERGILQFGRPNDGASYTSLMGTHDPLSRIWVLVDLNPHLLQPAGAFCDMGPFFVVVATPPLPNWFKWTKKIPTRWFFYLKPWSFSEVLQARSLIPDPPSEQALWNFHVDYGPSPRYLFLNAMHPKNYITHLQHEIQRVSPEKLRTLVESGTLQSEASHFLIQIGPSPTSRYVSQARVVTTRVFEMFWQRHKDQQQLYEMARFYDMSRRWTPDVAAMLFEVRAHQLLRGKRHISLLPILGHQTSQDKNIVYDDYRTEKRNKEHISLPGLQEVTLEEGITLIPGCYYRPRRRTDFPAIDSLLLIKPACRKSHILLMFHIVILDDMVQDEINKVGLEKVDDLIVPPNTKKFLVVVIPENVSPRIIVPGDYFSTGEVVVARGGSKQALPVFCYRLCRTNLFCP